MHLVGTTADSAVSRSGVNFWAITEADMVQWGTAAKAYTGDDGFELHRRRADPGCLVVRAADADGNPLEGAQIKKAAQVGLPDHEALYFNDTMDGFIPGGKTSASGVIILPQAGTGAYAVDHPDHTFTGSLGQGGPSGVCVIAEVRANAE